jgi:hypothetical protein
VLDRIGTTWEGLMGTSFRCVQCHDHPYDAFGHKEFYQFAALFNTTRDNDADEDFPLLRVAVNDADRARLSDLDARRSALRRNLHNEGIALAARVAWHPLRPARAVSTGQATLVVRDTPDHGPEVLTTGTIKVNSVFTLDVPAPDGGRFSALRIEVLPEDETKALTQPELGFVLSRLKVQVIENGTKPVDLRLVTAYDDDPDECFPAESSLNDDPPGWSSYPLIQRQRSAVFVAAEPVTLPPGASLRMVISQNKQSSGIKGQVIRRMRLAASGADEWRQLLERQRPQMDELRSLTREADNIAAEQVPVMAEQSPALRRETRIFRRGNWLDKGDAVPPAVPPILGGGPVRDRMELARWLTSPAHPLFARVAVNRFWEQMFGLGIVESIEEFGATGSPPSHPALLDWLALRFANDMNFRPKRLLREIVLSATYRQEAKATPELLAKDPRNRLLARGPRQRLTAEMVRDQALAVSGLLSAKMGGPPVMPFQPEGIWRTVYNGGKWITSPGEDAHRRALYTFIRRTSGYPSWQTFDAPTREFCTSRRLPTNTPLQALVTMNDPVYAEAAAALADRMAKAGDQPDQQLARGWRLVSGRHPSPAELSPLLRLHREAAERFAGDAKAAAALHRSPDLAALTIAANALLNLDAVLTR